MEILYVALGLAAGATLGALVMAAFQSGKRGD